MALLRAREREKRGHRGIQRIRKEAGGNNTTFTETKTKTNEVSGVWAKGKRVCKFICPKSQGGCERRSWVVRSGVVLLECSRGRGARGLWAGGECW